MQEFCPLKIKITLCPGGFLLNLFSPNIHIQFLQTDPHIFPWRISWENLMKDHSFFPLGDDSMNSHNHLSWLCNDIVGRKLLLIVIGTWSPVNSVVSLFHSSAGSCLSKLLPATLISDICTDGKSSGNFRFNFRRSLGYWGPFLESPSDFSGPEMFAVLAFKIKVSIILKTMQ